MSNYIKIIFAFFKNNYPWITMTFIFLVAFHQWVFNLGYLTSGDWPFYYQNFLLSFYSLPQIWVSYWGVGNIDVAAAFSLFKFLYGFLSHFFDYNISERILYFWPILIFSIFSSYIFLSDIFKSKIAVLVGMLVFNLNTYYLLLSTGHLTLMIAYSLFPVIFYLFKVAISKLSIAFALIASSVIFLSLSYEPRATYITLWVLFFYYIFTLFISQEKFIRRSIMAFMSVLPASLLSAYWVLPLSKSAVLTQNVLFDRNLFGNEFLNINYAFTLFQPFWTGTVPAIFEVQAIPLYFWLIPLIAILGLLFNMKNKYVIFFAIISILGIFLTKQVGAPFNKVYPFLYESFPGFNAFREASKFFFLIVLGYSVLIAAFVDWLWKNWTKGKTKIYGKYTLTILITAIFLWNTKPLITGEIGALFVPRTIPEDYKKMEAHLLSDNVFYRTFWIPTYSRWSFYSNTHPQVSAVNELNGLWRDLVKEEIAAEKFSEGELMILLLQKPEANNLLDASSVKYVFIPLHDIESDDDFFRYYGLKRDGYINSLDKLEYLERVDLGTNDVVVYENKDYKPHLYVTPEIESINKAVPHTDIDFQFINSTKYTAQLNNITEPVYLNFSESFHPQWKLRVGDFSWYDAIIQSDYFTPDKNHNKNDANLNSYYINPEELCAVYECSRNPDGSYTMDVTLYFLPQSYVYVGGIISLMTLLAILGFFGFQLYEKKKK